MLADQVVDTILYKAVTIESAMKSVGVPGSLLDSVRNEVLNQVLTCDSCNTWHMQADMDEDEGVCYECLALA